MTETESLLSRVGLFESLPESEIHHLAQTLTTLEAHQGTVLFFEGEEGHHLYIVREGEIEVVKGLGTPDEREIDILRKGDFVGEMSLFNRDQKRTASVRAKGTARLWAMTRSDFDGLLARQPNLTYSIVRVLSKRLTDAHNNAMADLIDRNRRLELANAELAEAYQELQAAQAQIIEKEKLERELQLAAEIQMSLLPRTLPHLSGFGLGAKIVPARVVGGDLYDFIPLGNDALAIVIGDVSDKGVPAAIFMAQTHALIRSEARQNRSPRETLERVNQYLLEMNASGLFVTVLYGILDRTTHEFHYARAGHELPLVRQPDGEIFTPPQGQGAPLGIFDFVLLDEGKVDLPPASTMLLITDGVTEALNVERQEFGGDRIQQLLRQELKQDAQTLCNDFLDAIARFRGDAPVHDDITVVAIQAT